MIRTREYRPCCDFLCGSERWSEVSSMCTLEIFREKRSEDDNATLDARFSQLLSLGNGCNTVGERLHRLECMSDLHRAESVCIGLDHRDDRNPGAIRKRSGIASQCAEVDFHPRTIHFLE